jgi:Rho guanine nucleotide exchange factor 7
MSAFKFEAKTSIIGVTVTRLPDTEKIKNAFEITGPSIERMIAICQSSAEANKWVELLSKHAINNSNSTIQDIKRNTSFTSGAHLNVSKKSRPFQIIFSL